MTDIVHFIPSDTLAQEFPEFSKISIYGTQEKPLLPVRQVQEFLGGDRIRLDKGNYLLGEDYIKVICTGRDGHHDYEQNLLTETGLYRVLCRSETPIGRKFLRFITVVMKELRIYGYVTAECAVNKLREYELEIKKKDEVIAHQAAQLEQRDAVIIRQDQQLEEEHKEVVKRTRESEKFYMQKMGAMEKLEVFEQRIKCREGQQETPEFRTDKLKEMFMAPLYVYIAKPPKGDDNLPESDPDSDDLEPVDDEDICFEVSTRKRSKAMSCADGLYIHKGATDTLAQKLHEHGFSITVNGKVHNTKFRGTINDLRDLVNRMI